MAIGADYSIAANGDIRYTGAGTNYTVIAFHRWLGDLMDDAAAAGNDILDITDSTASERSTDNYVTLKYPYNIDDIAAQHLYDGSIVQSTTSGNLGENIYDGILVYAAAGTYLQVIQNGNVVTPNFWTTALNADATNGISHRFMLKTRNAGTDIDGRKLIGQTREFGATYSQFPINGTSRGNNVMAVTYATDLNNATAAATVKGWTTIANTEGYQGIDVDGNTTNEYYYSKWDKSTYTINQFFERSKWLTKRATSEASCTDTGSDFAVGNATITGQAQSFLNGSNAVLVTRVFAGLKIVGAPTGNLVAKIYTHSGTYGTSSVPTSTALATSVNIDVSKLTTAYQTVEIGFNTQTLLTATTNYCVSFEYAGGDASNYVHVKGLAATGTHGGNRSQNTGTWAATATDDLNFDVHVSPKMYGVSGELFRGITHEVALTTPRTGSFSATELISWGAGATAGTGVMLAIDSVSVGTKMWIQLLTGAAPSASVTITGGTSAATATNTGTPTERTLSYPFCGASTGSAIIGSYGLGITASQLTASDKLFDLTTTQNVPPNNVTFTVSGIVSGSDRVLVGPATGSALNDTQWTITATLSGAAVTSVPVSAAIPSDTPASGTIRVKCNSGIYKRLPYTSFTGSTFTITSADFSADNATSGNPGFISYIDTLAATTSASFTAVYLSDRSLFIRVRDGISNEAIKTFETTGTLGSAGGSSTAIRTSDL